jgi:hypothetical protein
MNEGEPEPRGATLKCGPCRMSTLLLSIEGGLMIVTAALNTMANHGYISQTSCHHMIFWHSPSSGIESYEGIINGALEAFNMDRDLTAGLKFCAPHSLTDAISS